MHYNSIPATAKQKDLSHIGILGRCAGFALQVTVNPTTTFALCDQLSCLSNDSPVTPPHLGHSLLPLVPGSSQDIIWPLSSKMLFARAPGLFLPAHTSRLETGTQHAHSSKASPVRPQAAACWRPVQNGKTKQVTEKSHLAADQALLQAKCLRSPVSTSHPSHSCPGSFPVLRYGVSSPGSPSPTQEKQLHIPKQDLAHRHKWWD